MSPLRVRSSSTLCTVLYLGKAIITAETFVMPLRPHGPSERTQVNCGSPVPTCWEWGPLSNRQIRDTLRTKYLTCSSPQNNHHASLCTLRIMTYLGRYYHKPGFGRGPLHVSTTLNLVSWPNPNSVSLRTVYARSTRPSDLCASTDG